MKINIPAHLVPLEAINFSNYLSSIEKADEYLYDFHSLQHCHPFGLLVISSAIRENIKRYPEARHSIVNPKDTQGGQFAASFGFYQSIGQDIGEAKEEYESGFCYIPIKKLSAKELHTKYTDSLELNLKVNRHAGELSNILVGSQPEKVREAIQYCFREIIRNTFEHAKIGELWVCGQYWASRNEAEIAILDEGIGILKSLQSNSRINAGSCKEANLLAVQPGLSCTLGAKQDPNDRWQNSGYGLYVASTVCALNNGYFVLSSGDNALLISPDGQTSYNASQIGTAICVNVRVNSKKMRHFDKTLDAIVAEGERKASENGDKRILTASKVTTIASMIRHIEDAVEETVNNQESHIGEAMIPINTIVEFHAELSNGKGDIFGTFEYNTKNYQGVLLNVTSSNRERYINNNVTIYAVVRKMRGNIYTLLERHQYEKQTKQR